MTQRLGARTGHECRADRATTRDQDRLRLVAPEPLLIESLIGAILTKGDNHAAHLSTKRVAQLEDKADILPVEFRTHHLYEPRAVMRRIVAKSGCIHEDGVHPPLQQSTISLFRRRELLNVGLDPVEISRSRALFDRGDLLPRQVVGPVDGAADLLDGQCGRQLRRVERDEDDAGGVS